MDGLAAMTIVRCSKNGLSRSRHHRWFELLQMAQPYPLFATPKRFQRMQWLQLYPWEQETTYTALCRSQQRPPKHRHDDVPKIRGECVCHAAQGFLFS